MINISENKCVGCDLCIAACPNEALSILGGVATLSEDECDTCGICIDSCPQQAIRELDKEFLLAIGMAGKESLKLDDHFGNSTHFEIFKHSDGQLIHMETRNNPKFEEDESQTHGDQKKANFVASTLKNVSAIVAYRFGPNVQKLKNKFCCVVVRTENINQALKMIRRDINELIDVMENGEDRVLILR